MKYLITFLLLFSFHIIKAQIGVAENNLKEGELIYYYDKNWKGTSKEKAKNYKIITVNTYGEIIGEIYDYDKKGNLLALYESALELYKSDDNQSVYEGKYFSFYKSGNIYMEGNLIDGFREDKLKYYNKYGNVVVEFNYVGDYLNGESIWYYESGAVEQQLNYLNDKAEGKSTWYYESGAVEQEGNYVNDKAEGKYTWYYESGAVQREGNYVNDKLEGKYTWYYESNIKLAEGNYLNDKAEGKWIYYNESGKIESTEDYKLSKIRKLLRK